MTAKLTAGRRLRRDLDAALRLAGEEQECELYWTAQEQAWIGLACSAADRAESLQRLWDDSQAEGKSGALLRLSSELRMLERQIAELVGRLEVGAQGTAVNRLRVRPGFV